MPPDTCAEKHACCTGPVLRYTDVMKYQVVRQHKAHVHSSLAQIKAVSTSTHLSYVLLTLRHCTHYSSSRLAASTCAHVAALSFMFTTKFMNLVLPLMKVTRGSVGTSPREHKKDGKLLPCSRRQLGKPNADCRSLSVDMRSILAPTPKYCAIKVPFLCPPSLPYIFCSPF